MPLNHAANRDDRLAVASFLVFRGLENRIDAFLLRGIDKAARIHHNDICLTHVRHRLGAMGHEISEVSLGINGVFVAPEGD